MVEATDALALLDLPYVFSQHRLLTGEDFCKEAERRGVRIELGHLERLYLDFRLTPLYQIQHGSPLSLPGQPDVRIIPTPDIDGPSLLVGRTSGLLQYPMRQPRTPWSRNHHRVGGRWSWTSTVLYSPYQLMALDSMKSLLPDMQRKPPRRQWGYGVVYRGGEPAEELVDHRLLVLLHVIDRVYWPRLRGGQLIVPGIGDLDSRIKAYYAFMDRFDPKAAVATAGWTGADLLPAAERLIHRTWFFDPLEDWNDLVRLVSANRWDHLKGVALQALDYRQAAELLLYLHQALAEGGEIPPLPQPQKFVRTALGERLTADATELDGVLTRYGLSPHPSLLLVLEGAAEMTLVPRAMRHLGFGPGEHIIRLVEAGGVDRDVGFLASFAAVPGLGEELQPGVVLLTRPLTRILFVFDAEKRYATAAKRRLQKIKCVQQIEARIPRARRSPRLRRELNKLIRITTWGRYSFEFANFTDQEISQAIGTRVPVPVSAVTHERRRTGTLPNVERLFPAPRRIGKVDLADELWPFLEKKLTTRVTRHTLARLPLGRVLIQANKLAHLWPRTALAVRT
jgi:hypothetical protein